MKKLIVIGGPTAIGKTNVAIEIAQHLGTEILSADSRQCYKELNIGVAKPSPEQLALVPHHFIDSHSVDELVSAGQFEQYGLEKLDTIFAKKDVAVCVGGTGLYLKALCEGLDSMPSIDKKLDAEINETFKQQGLAWLQKEIEHADPLFYHQSEKENASRLLRALVFKLSTGESILSYRTNQHKTRSFAIEKYVLVSERDVLYQRINQRVDVMLQDGLVEEALSLYPKKELRSLQTVGYSELFKYFDGEYPLEVAIGLIKQHSRNYAKRQITWFKNQNQFIPLYTYEILKKFV